MKTALRVLFGLIMGGAGVIVFVYLGLLLNGPPNWRTGICVLVLLVVTQWVSFYVFRHGIALQVLFGLVVCAVAAVGLLYSRLSFFWETRSPDGSSLITWRSDVAFLLVLSASQWASYLIFRRTGRHRGKPAGTSLDTPTS